MGVSISRTQARAGGREVPSDRGRLARRFAARRGAVFFSHSSSPARPGPATSLQQDFRGIIQYNGYKIDQTFNRSRRHRRGGGIVIFDQSLSGVFAQGAEVRREELSLLPQTADGRRRVERAR